MCKVNFIYTYIKKNIYILFTIRKIDTNIRDNYAREKTDCGSGLNVYHVLPPQDHKLHILARVL